MVLRSGTANLPLHHGRVPPWLSKRMAEMGAAIGEVIILNEGRKGLLRRLSDPFWFQAFGAVMGMDWHSSGITTSVLGALKRGLGPMSKELGIHVCGGRGKHSLKTPDELIALSMDRGLDGDRLVRASKLTAKVDNVAVQDGFSLYLHGFIVTDDGDWIVIQQGMNGASREARRYHWRSENIQSFVNMPHDAVVGENKGTIVNLTDSRSVRARQASVDMVEHHTDKVIQELRLATSDRHLQMPAHHEVKCTDVFIRRLHGVLETAKNTHVAQFEDLLLTKGLGPRTMQALALVAEVAYGAPSRFSDPARYAFAHGGKDGHPHPVPLKVYDRSIHALKDALSKAKVGHTDKIGAFKRLEKGIRYFEKQASGPAFDEIVDDEWKNSVRYGGMTVLGEASPSVERIVRGGKANKNNSGNNNGQRQLKLF